MNVSSSSAVVGPKNANIFEVLLVSSGYAIHDDVRSYSLPPRMNYSFVAELHDILSNPSHGSSH
jgi:hypothetical protein